ncbi:coproporphyrinogen III oxidase [Rhodobacteraceae bacterium NNCM2]|nr:coproporphyrinogen III oxidase [Coraliihabitans acroporae]
MTGAGFGVYVHWPFCLAKCPYCDFNSHVSRTVDQAAWRRALVAELTHIRALTGQRRVETVFFGGGTPSLMPPETVAAVIDTIGALWSYAPDPEITLEANPTSVEAGKFRDYADAGVNRVSMGVQALNDADLKALGRMHSVAEARAAFAIAREAFGRVSFDLIYARMGQTLAAWEAELAEALSMAVDHLSLYQLTIEQGTRFFDLHEAGKLETPPDDLSADMYELTQQMTGAAGMPAYEVSNHAAPGAESRHNLIYWRGGEWAGAGPGAHGRIDVDGQRMATETARDPARWLAAVGAEGHALTTIEPVARPDQAAEYLLMAMRLGEGALIDRYEALGGRFDQPRKSALLSDGFLAEADGRLAATPRGRMILNRLLAEITA